MGKQRPQTSTNMNKSQNFPLRNQPQSTKNMSVIKPKQTFNNSVLTNQKRYMSPKAADIRQKHFAFGGSSTQQAALLSKDVYMFKT